MSKTPFELLLEKLPEIAEKVQLFNDGDLRLRAFDALMERLPAPLTDQTPVSVPRRTVPLVESPANLSVVEPMDSDGEVAITGTEDSTAAAPASPRRSTRRTGSAKKTFSVVKDLNFAPQGKQSLTDFIEEKAPRTNEERNLAACYYLKEMMEIPEVTVGHVLAVYRAAPWAPSSEPDGSLRKTAHRTQWLDTANMKDIKVVWAGQNHVETKMPTSAVGRTRKKA